MLTNRILEKNIPVPLYYQLKQIILDEIKSGEYKPGDLLPTETDLMEMFGISRTTVRQTMAELVNEGVLYRVKSQGTFVAEPRIGQNFIQKLTSFNEEMRQLGHTPSTVVLRLEEAEMPEEMCRLRGEPEGSKAIFLHRLRYADETPIVHAKTWLPYEKCKELLKHDFSTESLYSILARNRETKVYKVTRICRADAAKKEDTLLLDIKKDAPIHHFVSMGYSESGQLIEYSIARYHGDRSEFRVDVYPE